MKQCSSNVLFLACMMSAVSAHCGLARLSKLQVLMVSSHDCLIACLSTCQISGMLARC